MSKIGRINNLRKDERDCISKSTDIFRIVVKLIFRVYSVWIFEMSSQTPETKVPSVWQKIEVPETVDLPNFPALGKNDLPSKERQECSFKRSTKVKGEKFIVAPSRIVELKRARLNQAFPEVSGDPTRFNYTKPCKNIEKVDGSDERGVCTRDVCTYAHSLEEYKVPKCLFGDKCYRKDQTGDRSCTYMHPKENLDEYFARTGKSRPDLPETSEFTRRPEPRKDVPVVPVVTPVQSKPNAPALMRRTPPPSESTTKTTVIRVPKEMFDRAMEFAIKQGIQDFKIVIE